MIDYQMPGVGCLTRGGFSRYPKRHHQAEKGSFVEEVENKCGEVNRHSRVFSKQTRGGPIHEIRDHLFRLLNLETNIKLDGKKTKDFIEWISKLRSSLSIYNIAIFNIPQEQERPSEAEDSQATARAAWDAAKQDLFSILFFSTGGSAFFVARRFEGATLEGGAGHEQQAWTALREKFKGSSGEAIPAEH